MSAVALVSGGLDSAVVLWMLREQGEAVHPLAVDHGQRNSLKELGLLREQCSLLGFPLSVVHLGDSVNAVFGDSNFLSNADKSLVSKAPSLRERVEAATVPNRNMMFLSLALAKAITVGASRVVYGVHKVEEGQGAPDTRPPFTEAMQEASKYCHFDPIELEAPFLQSFKEEVVLLGDQLQVPFALTWSCHDGREKQCGVCSSCKLRRTAFAETGVLDPTEYLA